MAFSGDFAPLSHKHTSKFSLGDSIAIAVDRIHRNFETLEAQVKAMTECGLSDNDARLFIYRAFLDRGLRGVPRHLMFEVHKHYFEPAYNEFRPRNLWSLSNAFTSAFKTLKPTKQFEVTARLGQFFANERVDRGQVIDVIPKRILPANDDVEDLHYEYDDMPSNNEQEAKSMELAA